MSQVLDLFSLRPESALRPPDWRWDLARQLNDRRASKDDKAAHRDPSVTAAVKLQDIIDKGMTDAQRLAAYTSVDPDQADALVFHQRSAVAELAVPAEESKDYPMAGPLTADALARAQLEGLVLARKTPEFIAKRVGISSRAVEWYERWWFDVRDRLDRPGWVAAHVIGSLHQGSPALLLPALVRAYGYYTRSTRVVEAIAGAFDGPAARQAARDPAKFFAADAVSAGGLKAALAVRLMPLTRKTYARVMELHHAAMGVAIKTGQTDESEAEKKYAVAARQLLDRADRKYREAPDEDVHVEPLLPRLAAHDGDAG